MKRGIPLRLVCNARLGDLTMSNNQFQLGRLSGIPIKIDATFLLLAVLWGYSYFTLGTLNGFLAGFWIVVGVAFSILLHELAHAFAGRWYGVESTHIELNGLGGLCYFNRIAPSSKADIVISLAGPMANLALGALFSGMQWMLLASTHALDADMGLYQFASIAGSLASTNLLLFGFNLLPSHPLDGGKVLAWLIGLKYGHEQGQRAVAMTGMVVCAYLALISLGIGAFALLIAYDMYLHNQEALSTHKGPRWKREN